jgi:hypothetical protein
MRRITCHAAGEALGAVTARNGAAAADAMVTAPDAWLGGLPERPCTSRLQRPAGSALGRHSNRRATRTHDCNTSNVAVQSIVVEPTPVTRTRRAPPEASTVARAVVSEDPRGADTSDGVDTETVPDAFFAVQVI